METRSSGIFRRWPIGLLVEIAVYALVMLVSSLVALFVAGLA